MRQMQIKALALVIASVICIGMRCYNGKPCYDLNALSEHILKTRVIGIIVIGIESKHTRSHLIHYRTRGRLHQYILGKSRWQTSVFCKKLVKFLKLKHIGKLTEQKKISDLLKSVTVLRAIAVYKLSHIKSAVLELSVIGYLFAFINIVSVNVSYFCNSRHNTRSVGLAQAALYAVIFKSVGRNFIRLLRNTKAIAEKFLAG